MEAKFRDIPNASWEQVAPRIPVRRKRTLRGRPPRPNREVLAGIVYRLRTGCQWKALPQDFGSGSTCHRRFQEWVAAGIFKEIVSELLKFYDHRRGIQWKWSSLDSAMVKAPKWGPHGPEPDGSRQRWRETPHPDRWPRGPAGRRDLRRQRPR